LCYLDLLRGVGTVVLDAVGGAIDNCLNKLLYLPEEEQKEFAEKIVYCNMAGYQAGETAYDTYVSAWPMLYKLDKKETLDVTSQRIVDLISKTNKALASASIQGLPRVEAILTSTLQILAAHNLPISCAIDFLQNPNSWRGKIEEAATLHPEVIRARNRLINDFLDLPRKSQQSQAEVILNRLQRIEFDAVAEAMFSAPKPLVNWDGVVDQGKVVLIDLRHEKSDKARELKLFWVWGSIYEYIKSREANGRERPPLSVVIDELSYFVRGNSINRGVITEEFRQLMQVYKRNSNIWFTAATQEIGEIPSELRDACLKTTTHMYGAIDNPDLAKRLARRRRWKDDPNYSFYESEDLQKLYADKLQELEKGQWLAGASIDEGKPPTYLELIQTDHIDDGMYVQKKLVDKLKGYLMERDGVLVSDILQPPRRQKAPKVTPIREVREDIPRRYTDTLSLSRAGEKEQNTLEQETKEYTPTESRKCIRKTRQRIVLVTLPFPFKDLLWQDSYSHSLVV
jgi:hypothetical protein